MGFNQCTKNHSAAFGYTTTAAAAAAATTSLRRLMEGAFIERNSAETFMAESKFE